MIHKEEKRVDIEEKIHTHGYTNIKDTTQQSIDNEIAMLPEE